MRLEEYLRLRGFNALTNAEAMAIGITMVHGWVRKHKNATVPKDLVDALQNGNFKNGKERKNVLKKVAAQVNAGEKTLREHYANEYGRALDRQYKLLMQD